ncbi:MAG: YihY/virulence factor BrkB family protein [Planctomycetota bacterium]
MLLLLAKDLVRASRSAIEGFLRHDGTRMAAALSFFTVFSLAPLLMLSMAIAGLFFEPSQVRGRVETDLQTFVGPGGADQVKQMLETARRPEIGGLASLLGFLALVWGASSALFQLQKAMTDVWGGEPKPGSSRLLAFVLKRLFSVAMIFALGFVLVLSLVASAVARAFENQVNEVLPTGVFGWSPEVSNNTLSLALLVLLFAVIYKTLPDAKVRWRDVGVGALLTAGLFVLGKSAVALYLGRAGLGSSFGAAGSLALLMIWVFFSSTILLIGAEFTNAWAELRSAKSAPEEAEPSPPEPAPITEPTPDTADAGETPPQG